MESLEKLKELILETTEDNINNKNLLKALREEFIKKQLPITIPNQLFAEAIDEDHLEKNVLIAISKVFFNKLKLECFKLTNYFTEGELFTYENAIKVEESIDYVLFKNVKKIDGQNYLGVITGKQALEMRKNCLFAYYKEFQRSPKLVKTSSGRVIKKIDVSKKNIADMKDEFRQGTMTPTAIHFAVLVKNDKGIRENFKFKSLYDILASSDKNIRENYNLKNICKDVGDIWIKPNFDLESEDYLPFIIPDGFNRLTALCDVVEEAELEGEEIKAELGCFIHIFDDEASIKRFIVNTFKRADTNLDYLNSLQPTDENVFIDKFISQSNRLKGHVATTNQEMNIEINYVRQKVLIEAFKKTNIELNDSISSEIDSKKVAKIIDDILDYADIKDNKSIFLYEEMFKLYIKFAAEVRNRNYRMLIPNLTDYINKNENELMGILQNRNLKLDNRIEDILKAVISVD